MPSIEVDEFVYGYMRGITRSTGEQPSTFLRRLIEGLIEESDQKVSLINQLQTNLDDDNEVASNKETKNSSLSKFLATQDFQEQQDVVSRFLMLLSWLHQHHEQDFHKVLEQKGYKRNYFVKNPELVGGKNANPQQIPGSSYWVVTNSSTDDKQKLMKKVLKIFGYSQQEIQEASEQIKSS